MVGMIDPNFCNIFLEEHLVKYDYFPACSRPYLFVLLRIRYGSDLVSLSKKCSTSVFFFGTLSFRAAILLRCSDDFRTGSCGKSSGTSQNYAGKDVIFEGILPDSRPKSPPFFIIFSPIRMSVLLKRTGTRYYLAIFGSSSKYCLLHALQESNDIFFIVLM